MLRWTDGEVSRLMPLTSLGFPAVPEDDDDDDDDEEGT